MRDVAATNIALCEALGLSPYDVRLVTIRMEATRPPIVEVEYSAIFLLEHPEMVDAFGRFELVLSVTESAA